MKSRPETGDWRLEEKDKTFWDATGIERGDPHARPGAVCKQHLYRWLGGRRMTGFGDRRLEVSVALLMRNDRCDLGLYFR